MSEWIDDAHDRAAYHESEAGRLLSIPKTGGSQDAEHVQEAIAHALIAIAANLEDVGHEIWRHGANG